MGESQGIRHLSAEREAQFPKLAHPHYEVQATKRRDITALPTQPMISPENGIAHPFPTPATIGPPGASRR